MSILTKLQKKFPQLDFKPNFSLGPQTYSKIGGNAEVYLELKDRDQIIKVVNFCKTEGIKLTLLGGASNVIINDEGVSGLVLSLKNNEFIKLNKTNQDGKNLIRAEAGIKTSLLVKKTIDIFNNVFSSSYSCTF